MTELGVEVEVQQVASMVMTARRLLASGKSVDLSVLEGRVRGLCGAIGALPLEQGRNLRPSLEALMSGLDRLAADIDAHHRRLCAGQDSR